MRAWPAVLLVMFTVCAVRPAAAQLEADLSSHLISITSNFTGTELLLFGATDGPGDIVVVVQGPRETLTVRRKQRIAGIWLNGRAISFADVPALGSLDVLGQNRGANDLNVGLSLELETSDQFSLYAGVGGSFWSNGNEINYGGGLRWRFGGAPKATIAKAQPAPASALEPSAAPAVEQTTAPSMQGKQK